MSSNRSGESGQEESTSPGAGPGQESSAPAPVEQSSNTQAESVLTDASSVSPSPIDSSGSPTPPPPPVTSTSSGPELSGAQGSVPSPGSSGSGAPTKESTAETEARTEAKRVEAAKREHERKQYEARQFGELYSQRANWPRKGWKKIGGQLEKDSTGPRLQSGGGKDLNFGEGFYEGTDKSGQTTSFNIYFDGKGTAIPQGKGQLTEEKHSATIDFLASTQGCNAIVLDLDPSAVRDKQYKSQNIKLIEQHIKLCKQKGLSAEFGSQTIAFLQTLDKSEQDKYLKQQQELDVLRKEKDMLRGVDNTQRLLDSTDDVSKPAVTGFDSTQPNQYTTRVVTEAGADLDKQLAAVEAELDKVDKGIEQVDTLQARFDRDMDAQNTLLQEPEKLALASEQQFFDSRGKPETANQVKQRFEGAEAVVNKLKRDWTNTSNEALRQRHLEALGSKSTQLQEIGAAWKAKLETMRSELDRAKREAQAVTVPTSNAQPAEQEAARAKVAKIEAQIEKVGKNIERIDSARAKIEAQKVKLAEMKTKHDGQTQKFDAVLVELQERKQNALPQKRT